MSFAKNMRSLSRFWWIRLPAKAHKFSRLLAAALSDGAYLRASRPLAALLPPACLFLGVVVAFRQVEDYYVYSLLVISLLVACSSLGAALGASAMVGYVIGDLLAGEGPGSSQIDFGFDGDGVRSLGALAITYVLLFGLLVLIPTVSAMLRLSIRQGCDSMGIDARLSDVAYLFVYGGLVFLWTQSTPFLIRPVWSYFGRSPEVPAIEPLQQRGWVVVLVAIVVLAARIVGEHRAARFIDPFAAPGLGYVKRRSFPKWLPVVGYAVFSTALLSGLLETWFKALLTFTSLSAVFTIHRVVLPRFPTIGSTIERVPLAFRLVAGPVVAYFAGQRIVTPAVDSGSQSFTSLIIAAVVSLAFISLLLPHRPEATA